MSITAVLMLLIFLSNPRRLTNKALTFFVFSVFVWLVTNFLTNIASTSELSLSFARSTLIGGVLVSYSFLIFAYVYTEERLSKKTERKLIKFGIPPLILLALTPTSLNIKSIEAHGVNAKPGLAYYLLILELIVYFTIALRILYRCYKRDSTSETQKQQIKYIFIGFVLTAIPAVITSVVLPLLNNGASTVAAYYGPNSAVILAIFTSIAIIRHGLLDIRLVVVRSVGYVLTVAAITLIFILPAIILSTKILHGSIPNSTAIFLGVITCIVAILFQFLKATFDKVTRKIFFRDYYNFQDVLDDLGDLLVRSIDLEEIKKGSSKVLNAALKSSFIDFSLITNDEERSGLANKLQKFNSNLISTDDLDISKYQDIYSDLTAANVSLAIKLRTTKEDLGFMLVGYKQSGSLYTQTDRRLLTIAADELAVGLQNALRFQEIEQFNVTLQQKVDEATIKLRKANEKLRALDETKDDFISMASHQLRTPLTSVKGYISMVLDGDVGKISKSQKDMLNQAFFSSQRMVYLIADLLNVSRLKTGKFVIEPAPVNLAEVVQQELSQLGETATSKELKLTYDKPKTFPTLMLDETKTRQVIMNFVDNAIYYTPNGGAINVRLVDNSSSVELRVEDNGIGVPKAEQHHLFNKFYRAGNARKARPDGTGLGLFMAKKVVLAEGGSIIFESAEGKGSTFGFVFPKGKLTPKDGGKMPVKEEATKEKELTAA